MGGGKNNNNSPVKELEIFALATDPIYIGTGGYTIGRVDNTIVRDPITNVPKIPGSSLAGTWRYYVVLHLITKWKKLMESLDNKKVDIIKKIKELINSYDFVNDDMKDSLKTNLNLDGLDLPTPRNFMVNLIERTGLKFEEEDSKEIKTKKHQKQEELFKIILEVFNNDQPDYLKFTGNRFLQITCAGQDNIPQEELANAPFVINTEGKTGHCGHCIVCKGFGFSKKDVSWQGMLFFSDLEIIFFPVFTIKGVKWITTQRIIGNVKHENGENNSENEKKLCFVFEKISGDEAEGHINLGWLYLPYKLDERNKLKSKILKILKDLPYKLNLEDIIIVPEDLFPHIVNSNLEVRTSVSIDPITGAAKEGALFTSEAIPRGTIFYGNVRIFDKKGFEEIEEKLKPLPTTNMLERALENSKHFYETLGIGGMTTRGFGRLLVCSPDFDNGGV